MPLDRKYDQIVMLEVLEHIMDDALAINVLSRNLAVGGRLVISTPTQSNGLLRGDRLSETEDGGHVRVGYDGPDLDALLRENALRLVTRRYNGNRLLRHQLLLERRLRRWCLPIGITFGLMSRLPVRFLDFPWGGWFDQITVAERISIQSEMSDPNAKKVDSQLGIA